MYVAFVSTIPNSIEMVFFSSLFCKTDICLNSRLWDLMSLFYILRVCKMSCGHIVESIGGLFRCITHRSHYMQLSISSVFWFLSKWIYCVSAYHYTKVNLQIMKTLCATQLKEKAIHIWKISATIVLCGSDRWWELKIWIQMPTSPHMWCEWMNEWYHVGGNNSQTFSFFPSSNFIIGVRTIALGFFFLFFFFSRIILFTISKILNTAKREIWFLSFPSPSERQYSFIFMFHRCSI